MTDSAHQAEWQRVLDKKVSIEQVSLLYGTIFTASIGDTLLAWLFGLFMYWQTQQWTIFLWLAMHFYNLIRWPVLSAWSKDEKREERTAHWATVYCRELRFNSIVWGMGPLLFLHDSLPLISLTMLVVMGVGTAGVVAVAPLWRAVYNYILPMNLGLMAALLLRFDVLGLVLATCNGIYLAMVLYFGRAQNRLLVDALRSRFEKADLAERLEQQMLATKQMSLEKTRFLAAASHDLRQPLHAIALLGSALEKQLAGRPEQANAKRLMGAVNTLGHSLDTMLDVSRLDAGVVAPERQPVALQQLFQSLNQGFVNAAIEKDIQLRIRSTRLWVDSDPQLLRRLLSNLIDNAIKYTHAGGVLVVARRRSFVGRASEVWVEVHDSGIGIAQEQQARVFEEFYQINNPGRDRALGLGIGLSVVARLSRLLAHPVTLTSTLGKGTRFRLCLPEVDLQRTASMATAGLPGPLRKEMAILPTRVLVLDDEAVVRDAMRQLLSSYQVDVAVAATEGEATALLASAASEGQPFELLLCDYRLADGVDGLEVGQALSRRFADLPLLLITGETAPERLQRVHEAGVPVLFKPVAVERLLQVMAGMRS